MDNLWIFLGRLHPIAVHLPIGILLLLGVMELAALFPRAPRLSPSTRTFFIVLGVIAAGASALFGWLLARDGGYNAELLSNHRNSGIATAALAAVLLIVHLLGWRRAYGVTLALTVGVLCIAGHFGGTLTHGENYLALSPANADSATTTDPARAVVFNEVIHPILEQRCVSCHGPTKSNGDLRYDRWEFLVKGGKSGPAFKPGNAAISEMVRRAHLPLDAKKHMPPKGKPQLTDNELTLLEWWIDSGASHEKTLLAVAPPPAITEILATRFPALRPPMPDRVVMLAAAAKIESATGVIIRPLSQDTPWLSANARLLGAKFGDAQLAELAPIAPALYALDLGETGVTDSGLLLLETMPQLRKLQLDGTKLTDAGLQRVAQLARLESLNLHRTAVTDKGIASLYPLKQLRSLFVWQTQVTPAAARELGEQVMDHRRLNRWQGQISDLQNRIRAEHFQADFGARLPDETAVAEKPAPPR